jgi:hypothetical protein
MGTPYFGAIIMPVLLELFPSALEIATSAEEDGSGGASTDELEVASSELDSGAAPSELEARDPVAELELGFSTAELDKGVPLSPSADVVFSQLAQKNAVSESRIFFQCL